MVDITQKRLKQLLHYDPKTGVFTWKEFASSSRPKGSQAGCFDKAMGYVAIGIDNKLYRAHRLAWLYQTGDFPEAEIDHIDHNRSNNSFSNLRLATSSINNKNRSLSPLNKSGFTGVHLNKKTGSWIARIKVNGKNIYLGAHKEKTAAINARRKANKKYGFHENHGAQK